jgi:methylisocitrate lyase
LWAPAGHGDLTTEEMVDRIKAAADARTDEGFYLIARTDAIASEGVDAALERAARFVEAGADGVFADAAYDLDTHRRFTGALGVPVLANIAEFGQTPLFTVDQLASAGVGMVLYPLNAFRAANRAAEAVYAAIRRDGTQQAVLDTMQTRAELYKSIHYHAFEEKLDALYARKKGNA